MITIPVSTGELIDKISILSVKLFKIKDEEKLAYVRNEITELTKISKPYMEQPEITTLFNALIDVNSKLWDVEDELRRFEEAKIFKDQFVSLARQVYFLNDERFALKNRISKLTDSEIQEVKDYIQYK